MQGVADYVSFRIIDFHVKNVVYASRDIAVFLVYSLFHRNHAFLQCLDVVGVSVGVKNGIVLVSVLVVEGTVSSTYAEQVNTVLQTTQFLVDVETSLAIVFSSPHVAVCAVIGKVISVPASKSVGEVGVVEQYGYVCSCRSICSGNAFLQIFHVADFCVYTFCVKCLVFVDVDIRTVDVGVVWFNLFL